MMHVMTESHSAITNVLADLLTDVPHVMFCLKDLDGRYLAVNQAFADRAGRTTVADVVGLTANDLFPAELAESYERQDARVISTGEALRNELELILRPDGSVGWYVTSKTLLGPTDAPFGIASVSVDLRAAGRRGWSQRARCRGSGLRKNAQHRAHRGRRSGGRGRADGHATGTRDEVEPSDFPPSN